jgi:hypothetical protein
MNSMSMRNALSKDLLPASSAYVSNATISLYVFASVADILTKPLSYLASKVREGVAQQSTREQIGFYGYCTRLYG